jgi:arginyl-tRNA synthetase
MIFEKKLTHLIANGFKDIFNAEIKPEDVYLQPTRKEFEGTHTFVVFPYLKYSKRKPEETAEALGNYLVDQSGAVEGFNVIKGFLNIKLSKTSWLQAFAEIMQTQDYGFKTPHGKHVIVEYSSPNTNKPLHLGHLRNNFLGYSVSEILKANGYDVAKVNLVNDRGIHICKSMLAYQEYGNGETPETSGIKGDHLVGKYYVKFDAIYKNEIQELVASGVPEEDAKAKAPSLLKAQEMLKKWEEGDDDVVGLWKKMNSWVYTGFDETYRKIGVDFDKYYYESDTYLLGKKVVEEGLQQSVFHKKDNGSVWVDLSAEGLDEKLLLRADGTSVYITQDLGTAELKYQDYHYEKSVYVVGNEQDYHFDVLIKILKKLGKPYADSIYHLSYGMVDLPSGKMKSREGTVVDADDLVQEMLETAERHTKELGKIEGFSEEQAKELYEILGLGALKYFLLRVDPKKRMLFNPEESIQFQGFTGPFIQYTHARVSAIVRKAKEMGVYNNDPKIFNQIDNLLDVEKNIIYLIGDFGDKVEEAGKLLDPSVVAQHIFELSREYNSFYAEASIFNCNNDILMRFRVALSDQVARVIRSGLMLLGIEAPERM